MGYKAQRLGFSIGRGWTLLLLLTGGLLAAAYWIGPLRALPAELELRAVAGDVAVSAVEADGHVTTEGTARFAVPLAVRNIGAQPARPWQLRLSVPGHYHLSTPRGRLIGEVTAGVPLRRYTIDLPPMVVPIDSATMRMPGLDSIWIEPDLPRYYCVLDAGTIPEFIPAPARDPETLSNVTIFYSFRTQVPTERHTGLLDVRLDPAMLQSQPAPRPPTFPTEIIREPDEDDPAAPPREPADTAAADTAAADTARSAADDDRPAEDAIRLVTTGTRRAYCGDPEAPIELYTIQQETPAGGLVYTVHVGEQPRKRLYDLAADGVVELERWDSDGDGFFEARREASYRVPEFIVPRPPRRPELLEPDTVPPDSAWLRTFANIAAGPFRFSRSREAAPPVAGPDSLLADSLRADTLRRGTLRPGMPDTLRPPGAMRPDTAVRDTTPARDTAAAPRPAPRRRGPIGTPIRIPPDTIPR